MPTEHMDCQSAVLQVPPHPSSAGHIPQSTTRSIRRGTSASRTHGLPKCSPSSFTLRPSKCATVGCAWRCWTHSTNTTRSIPRGMSANRKHGLPKCSPANVTLHTSAQLSGVPGACWTQSAKHHQKHMARHECQQDTLP